VSANADTDADSVAHLATHCHLNERAGSDSDGTLHTVADGDAHHHTLTHAYNVRDAFGDADPCTADADRCGSGT